jgi:hypothetical protein
MNILLWTLQVLLALWNLIGGSFAMTNYGPLNEGASNPLPQSLWVLRGTLQLLFAVMLVLPP